MISLLLDMPLTRALGQLMIEVNLHKQATARYSGDPLCGIHSDSLLTKVSIVER